MVINYLVLTGQFQLGLKLEEVVELEVQPFKEVIVIRF
jgi:hypothetical protein